MKTTLHKTTHNLKDIFQRHPWRWIALLAVIVVLVVGGLYLLTHTLPKAKVGENIEVNADVAQQVVGELKSVYPAADQRDHTTVTLIGAPEKLEQINGLKGAEVGDYLIKYDYLNHSVLWRPSSKKIIAIVDTKSVIGLVVADDISRQFVTKLTRLIEGSSPAVSVHLIRAQRSGPNNIVVVNNPRFATSASTIARDIGGKVADLPDGVENDKEASLRIFINKEFEIKTVK